MTIETRIEYLDDNKNIVVLEDETHPVYIVKGPQNFLIDSGIAPKAAKYRGGIETILAGDKLHTLLLTHSHYDHVGSCSYLQDIFGFKVLGSSKTVQNLQNPDMIELIDFHNQDLKTAFKDDSDTSCEMPQNVAAVADGERIDLGDGRYFEVFAVPGHSVCSLAYLLQPEGVLFPGDAAGILEIDGRLRPVFFSSFGNYEASLEKMAALDVSALAFAHSAPVRGREEVKKYFARSLAETRKLKEKILQELARSKSHMLIAQEIFKELFVPGSIMGSQDNYVMNMLAMVNAVGKEFVTANYQ